MDAKGNVEPDQSHTKAEAVKLWDNTGMVPSTVRSFLPTSPSSLQRNHLTGGFSWTYSVGHYPI